MGEGDIKLTATAGPLAGREFAMAPGGLRIGRSSSCEIPIADPAISRNHCLLELRDGGVCVTDLSSANGTQVNGEDIGGRSVRLNGGDELQVGESVFRVSYPAAEVPAEPPAPVAVDLGLGDRSGEASPAGSFRGILRGGLWILALAAAAAAGYVILSTPVTDPGTGGGRPVPEARLHRLYLETVKVGENGIFRHETTVDGEGTLRVFTRDLPGGGRNLEKSKKLEPVALAKLSEMLGTRAVAELEPSYAGPAVSACRYERSRLRIVRGLTVKDVTVENATEPEAFRELRLALETFAQHELGIVGIQLPREELLRRSADAARTAEEKWDARDVELGNLAAAIAGWNDAVYFLETVNPKPDGYEGLLSRRDAAKAELDRRWRERYFEVDRAIHGEDWERARGELTALCALIGDRGDRRYGEARKKLADVESRARKGGGR